MSAAQKVAKQTSSTMLVLSFVCGSIQMVWAVQNGNASVYFLSLGVKTQDVPWVWLAGPISGEQRTQHRNIKLLACLPGTEYRWWRCVSQFGSWALQLMVVQGCWCSPRWDRGVIDCTLAGAAGVLCLPPLRFSR